MKKLNFLFLFFCGIVYSQYVSTTKQIDSIQKTIYTTTPENVGAIESTCIELYYKSKDIGYSKGQMESLLRLSAFRVNSKKDLEKASDDLSKVEKLSLAENNYYYYCKAKGFQSAIFNSMDLYDKAKNILDKNFKLISKIQERDKRKLMEAFYYGRYINLYGYQNMKDSVQHYGNKRLQVALQLPENEPEKPLLITSTARLLTTLYGDKKEYGKMEYYLKVQEKYIKNINNLFDLAFYHKTKAEYIFSVKHKDKIRDKKYLDSALYHFKLAEKYAVQDKNPTAAQAIYQEIANVYKLKDSIEKQAKYLNSYTLVKDTVKKTEDKFINAVKLETSSQEYKEVKDKLLPVVKNNSDKIYVWIIIILLALVGIVLFIKNKRVSANQKETIMEIQDSRKEISIGELTEMALHNSSSFYINFLRIFPDLGSKLLKIDPTLKPSDIEFCAFLKLNLDTKQIAHSKKMTIRAVEAKKYRIRKRLGVPSRENLYTWISHV